MVQNVQIFIINKKNQEEKFSELKVKIDQMILIENNQRHIM